MDQRIAGELGVAVRQVSAAVELLDGGATVPFIARYRKEATGTLDDAQLRTLEERLHYLRELANTFHSWYNAAPILVDEAPLRDARVALAQGVRQVIRNGLGLLGVSAPDSM